ncbi:ABC transporter permease [Salipaludibacillus sp. HK11]|uniref:ABC transporter permease n=1 Tax=Salipaludibacillus sp. HK11 TaxID=3394320 RepID=UPI0039FD49C5
MIGFKRTGNEKLFNNKSNKSRLKPYLFLLPALLVTALFVGHGLFMAAKESFVTDGNEIIFHYYVELWKHDTFLYSLRVSVWVAFISTAISLVIGLLITRVMFRLFSRDGWKFIAWFPMLIPHFVAAYICFLLFAPSGWLSSVFFQIGWLESMSQFPVFVNDPLYIGVIFTYIWKEIPFVVLMLLPVYQEMDLRFEDVSRTLGGNKWSVFKTVEFPWVWPISLEVFLILFVFILGAFEVPALLGVTYPKMIPVLAYEWFYQGQWANRPLAQAMMICMSVVALIAAVLILTFTQRWRAKWATSRGDDE